jgi:hypothetical protein
MSGSFSTVGTITAQTLVVQTVTSSVSFITGSTRFGTLAANTHTFTGSMSISGSLTVSTTSSPGFNIVKDSSVDNRYIRLTNTQASSKNWDIINQTNALGNNFQIFNSTDSVGGLTITPTGNVNFGNATSNSHNITGSLFITGAFYVSASAFQIISPSTAYGGAINLINSSNNRQWNITNVGSGTGTRNGNLEINNNSIDILAISQSGNIGIGTTSPTEILEVKHPSNNGSLRKYVFKGYDNTGNINGVALRVYDTAGGTSFADIAADYYGTGANTNLTFSTRNGGGALTERMRIANDGQVQVRGEGIFGLDFSATQYIAISENQIRRIGNSTLFINNSNTGDVSININGGGTFVNGTNGYGRAVTNSSDERIKKNIVKIDNALDKVINMDGVYYEFDVENELGVNVPNENKRIGLIAQQIETILPEAVFTPNEDNQPKSIDYSGMVGLLINAIQEQQATITSLQTRIEQLENK